MIKLDVRVEKAAAEATLRDLGIEFRYVGRNILRSLASLGKKTVQKNMGASLNFRTGDLKRHVYGFVRSAAHAVVSTSRGYKAEMLERGGTIKPKKGKYLTFRSDSGGWVKVKQVTMPARHWFKNALGDFEGSPAATAATEKEIDKAIKRAER